MTIDQELMEAYLDYGEDMVRRGMLDCEMPHDDEAVEDWMRRKLREAGREVPGD